MIIIRFLDGNVRPDSPKELTRKLYQERLDVESYVLARKPSEQVNSVKVTSQVERGNPPHFVYSARYGTETREGIFTSQDQITFSSRDLASRVN